MAACLPLRGRDPALWGRRGECEALDRLIEAVRAGASRVLVVRGEPGVGKTVLLDYLAGHASGCRVVRAAGVQMEMEMASVTGAPVPSAGSSRLSLVRA
jgi:ABC-type transport system involved in cytochrome c biogenesis ATPase subunit